MGFDSYHPDIIGDHMLLWDKVRKVRILSCAEGEFSVSDGAHFVLLLLLITGFKVISDSFS